jgi:hypothetical protein
MGTVAFSGQKFFEWQALEQAAQREPASAVAAQNSSRLTP